MSQWKILSQKTVLKTELFTVKSSKLKFDSGKIKEYFNVYRDDTAVIFAITPKKEIYLIQEKRYLLGKEIISAPAGFISKGEDRLLAAKRELSEETGLKANQWEVIAVIEAAASVIKARAHLFLAKDLEIGEQNLEELENIELLKMPLDSAVKKVMSGEISHSATVIGILMLDRYRRENKL